MAILNNYGAAVKSGAYLEDKNAHNTVAGLLASSSIVLVNAAAQAKAGIQAGAESLVQKAMKHQ